MKKCSFFLSVALIATMFVGCDPNKNNPSGDAKSGTYLGVIGFNDALNIKDISILDDGTKWQFTSFIDNFTSKNGTLLYHSVNTAIDKLEKATLPSDLSNVSIVTFTDGLDQGSREFYADKYNTNAEILEAVKKRIGSTKIKGLPINAYSIGIKGNDVTDAAQFTKNLKDLASSDDKYSEVTDMEEVKSTFSKIAASLYKTSTSQSISLALKMQDVGAKIRFTFDNVSDATNSNMYIEGVWGSNNSLSNVVYQGLSSTSGATLASTKNGNDYVFKFENLQTTAGANVPTNKIQQWAYISSTSVWQVNSEFVYNPETVQNIERKSAVIILVLDCSSSLGNKFSNMQSSGKSFIDVLLGNNSSNTAPSVTTSSATSVTQNSATLNGNITNVGNPAYTEKGFCYSTSQNPTTSSTKVVVSGSGTGSYSKNVTGLTANKTYYVRAYATNSQGTEYGAQVSFTTTSQAQNAQVRFQKIGNEFYYVTYMDVSDANDPNNVFASYEFGTSTGTSPYYVIPAGYHIPYLYYAESGYEGFYYVLDSPYTYNFQAGRKYTVKCSDDGFSVTNDGTF